MARHGGQVRMQMEYVDRNVIRNIKSQSPWDQKQAMSNSKEIREYIDKTLSTSGTAIHRVHIMTTEEGGDKREGEEDTE